MAEFVEVMKQKQRMCDFHMETNNACRECDLCSSNNRALLACNVFTVKYPEEAEKIIMDWAKEHPVKTNVDKFKEVFGNATASLITLHSCSHFNCQDLNVDCDNCQFDGFWEKEYKDPKE